MKTVKLGDTFTISSSRRVLKSQWKSSGIPFYRGREITRLSKTGNANNELYISEDLYNDLSHKNGVPTEGDIMITAIGTIGNTISYRQMRSFILKTRVSFG
ncbi:restriction endonuclease subunit S [Candidatus Saccharibacteria bacterium]|nr:MAG: restriction endonuclease subunit S [Candidatus Saccharibacteria bacterium]